MTDQSETTTGIDPHSFPATVDVPVPPTGFGDNLDKMRAWCAEQFGDDQWAQHITTVAWPPSAPGVDVARFCFADEAQADQFERRWCR